MTHWFEIDPIDTLFFRDSRPFNKDETITLAGVESIFPPSPATVAGAILASFATNLGWKGGPWKPSIKEQLGIGDNIKLKFTGVYLLKDNQVYYPLPQCVVKLLPNQPNQENDNAPPADELGLLAPSSDTYYCDLGKKTYLPKLAKFDPDKNIKQLKGAWISKTGIESVLNMKELDSNTIKEANELWQLEPRVGIARDNATGSTEEGALYSPSHVRLCRDVSMLIGVSDIPPRCKQSTLIHLGGESRTATTAKPTGIEIAKDLQQGNMLVITSPTYIDQTIMEGLEDDIKTACMPKKLRFGGWNGLKRKPRPVLAFLAPGTVLFMNKSESKDYWQEKLGKRKPGCEFSQENFGFGDFFLGSYKEKQ